MANRVVDFGDCPYELSYEIKNQNAKDVILILHGWGANKELMIKAFGDKFQNLKQIYLDLPGFGKSSISKPINTEIYAKIVAEFCKNLGVAPNIIMGHSFGGKVATLLNPKNLVLLSTAGIIEPKPLKVRLKIAFFKILKNLGLGKFWRVFATNDVKGMDKTMYEILKMVVNEDFSSKFSSLSSDKSLIFWGKDDNATHLTSGEKIHSLIANSEFYPLEGDHFFFLKNADFIAQKIENLIKS